MTEEATALKEKEPKQEADQPACPTSDEVEERRERRKMQHWLIRYVLIVTSILAFMLVGGGLYGWLFQSKEFLGEVVLGYITHFFDVLKYIFTI